MIRSPPYPLSPHHQTGIGLVEILVTVFVLSVGLLGVAVLQAGSKKANYEAVQRTTASMLASDILERMRLNAGVLHSYDGATVGGGTITTEPDPHCDAAATACTTTQLANHDLWQWEQALDGASDVSGGRNVGGLASPTACITSDAGTVDSDTSTYTAGNGASGTYTVAIAWRGHTAQTGLATRNGCGDSSDDYGVGDKFRRLLVISAYIRAG